MELILKYIQGRTSLGINVVKTFAINPQSTCCYLLNVSIKNGSQRIVLCHVFNCIPSFLYIYIYMERAFPQYVQRNLTDKDILVVNFVYLFVNF